MPRGLDGAPIKAEPHVAADGRTAVVCRDVAQAEVCNASGPTVELRRSRYPATLRRALTDLLGLRHQADDRVARVSQREAAQQPHPPTEPIMGYVVYLMDETRPIDGHDHLLSDQQMARHL